VCEFTQTQDGDIGSLYDAEAFVFLSHDL